MIISFIIINADEHSFICTYVLVYLRRFISEAVIILGHVLTDRAYLPIFVEL